MKVLTKQETPTGNIALLAIFSAILVSFSLLMAFVPPLSIVLGFFLPLVSAVAIYYTENKYIPFYIIGASALCMGVTFFNFGDTLFFVIPSIISGSLFGFLRTKKLLPQLNLFVIGLAQFVLHVLAYYLLIAITGVDLVKTVSSFLGLDGKPFADLLILSSSFMLAFSFGESGLNHLMIEGFLNKFSEEQTKDRFITRIILSIISILAGISSIVFGVFGTPLFTVSFVVSAFFAITCLDVFFVQKRPIWIYVLLGISFLLSIFLFAIFNQFIEGNNSISLLSIFPISLSIVTFVSNIENKMAK